MKTPLRLTSLLLCALVIQGWGQSPTAGGRKSARPPEARVHGLGSAVSWKQQKTFVFSVTEKHIQKLPFFDPAKSDTVPVTARQALEACRKTLVGEKDILPKADPLGYALCSITGNNGNLIWFWYLDFKDDGVVPGTGHSGGAGNRLMIPVMMDGTVPSVEILEWKK